MKDSCEVVHPTRPAMFATQPAVAWKMRDLELSKPDLLSKYEHYDVKMSDACKTCKSDLLRKQEKMSGMEMSENKPSLQQIIVRFENDKEIYLKKVPLVLAIKIIKFF